MPSGNRLKQLSHLIAYTGFFWLVTLRSFLSDCVEIKIFQQYIGRCGLTGEQLTAAAGLEIPVSANFTSEVPLRSEDKETQILPKGPIFQQSVLRLRVDHP
jgi:hypothetical protein